MRSALASVFHPPGRHSPRSLVSWLLIGVVALASCAPATTASPSSSPQASTSSGPPSPDPRVGLGAGLLDAEQAIWNLSLLSETPPPSDFVGSTNSDLAFIGEYAIQGNYNGFQIWDIGNPANPTLVTGHVCPASQSDVSVYQNLLFVSGEGYEGRLDCGTQGVDAAVSQERLRGIRIFDISDVRNPEYVGNVQTCRGSHTHSLLVDPDDDENVYVYVSGSAPLRSEEELPGCVQGGPDDPSSALFRIEVIRVPLARPQDAAIVSSPRIFSNLVAPPAHGPGPDELARIEEARAGGAFVVDIEGQPYVLSNQEVSSLLGQLIARRGGSGAPTAADSAMLRVELPLIVERMLAAQPGGPDLGPDQCHDITLYPDIGLGGGACEGYGFLLDIRDPINPRRISEVADSNFAYWHSATFSNEGDRIVFTDEWGGGGQPKCRASDPAEWGADAIFTIDGQEMEFESYYKLPAAQTEQENCVAHNGSLIPIPGRDVMVQAWYQGGISIFDFTDPENPFEIAFFDRGPVDASRPRMGGSWSAYWYNGYIYSSEIARGFDVLELMPSEYISENEIEAARSVVLDHFNPQGQQQFEWPASFALARSYVDQLERSEGLSEERLGTVRRDLLTAEFSTQEVRREVLLMVAAQLTRDAFTSEDAPRVRILMDTLRELATGLPRSS